VRAGHDGRTGPRTRSRLLALNYSVYTPIVRLALEFKGVAFEFEPLDVFAADGPEKARQAGHVKSNFGSQSIKHGKQKSRHARCTAENMKFSNIIKI